MTEEKEIAEEVWETDGFLKLCVQQGYVPEKCYLNGVLVFAITSTGKHPCWGCNLDRSICCGLPKKGGISDAI